MQKQRTNSALAPWMTVALCVGLVAACGDDEQVVDDIVEDAAVRMDASDANVPKDSGTNDGRDAAARDVGMPDARVGDSGSNEGDTAPSDGARQDGGEDAPVILGPVIVSTVPVPGATGVSVSADVVITFNRAIAPATVTADSVFLSVASGAKIPGSLETNGTKITFTPTDALSINTLYTVTIAKSVTDVPGIPLAADVRSPFTTGPVPAAGPMAVNLGTAANYAVLSKTGISATPGTRIVGNIGVSPIFETAITGFGQVRDSTNEFSKSTLVTGRIEAADMGAPTPAKLTAAIGDMENAFTDAAGRALPIATEFGAGSIGGLTLVPGLYKWSSNVLIATAVTFAGGPHDVWILQIAGNVGLSEGIEVRLAGGARAKNIYWQVSGQVVLGTTSRMKGNIMAQTLIALQTGAVLDGRALAQAAVTLDASTVTAPPPR